MSADHVDSNNMIWAIDDIVAWASASSAASGGRVANADADADTDITPEPAFPVPPPSLHTQSNMSESRSTTGSSTSSRNLSPAMHLTRLALRDDGVEKRALRPGEKTLPESIFNMFQQMDAVAHGMRVVPRQFETLLAAEHARNGRTMPRIQDHQWDTDSPYNPDGNAPDAETSYSDAVILEGLLTAQDKAMRCLLDGAPVYRWNNDVYTSILELALGCVFRRRHHLLSVIYCPTSATLPVWLPSAAFGTKVDHCYVVDIPMLDSPSLSARTDKTRLARPGWTINHTEAIAFEQRPIALSVVNAASDEAELQLAIWLAAQWNSLADLCGEERKLDDLPFLPALIINGHHWSWAAATREGSKTVIWSSQQFGSTWSIIGIFKILAGIRLLTKYIEEVYWPWFQANALPPA